MWRCINIPMHLFKTKTSRSVDTIENDSYLEFEAASHPEVDVISASRIIQT